MILIIYKFHSPSLSHISRINLLWWIKHLAYIMDRCNYLVPNTNWMVEMPLSGGQYHQAIASLWISHLVDNLPLSPVMLAHIDSAQLTNPRKLNAQSGIISLFFSQAHEMSVDLSLPHLIFRTDVHFQLPLYQILLHHLRHHLAHFVISQF